MEIRLKWYCSRCSWGLKLKSSFEAIFFWSSKWVIRSYSWTMRVAVHLKGREIKLRIEGPKKKIVRRIVLNLDQWILIKRRDLKDRLFVEEVFPNSLEVGVVLILSVIGLSRCVVVGRESGVFIRIPKRVLEAGSEKWAIGRKGTRIVRDLEKSSGMKCR